MEALQLKIGSNVEHVLFKILGPESVTTADYWDANLPSILQELEDIIARYPVIGQP